MSEDQKRPEATHRQRADLGHSSLEIDGQQVAVISVGASDLIPTVQYGNVLLQCQITRAVPDAGGDSDEAIIEASRRFLKHAEFVVGAERRILQWAIDPSSRVQNPATGAVVTPDGDVAAQNDQRDPAAVAPPPSAS